MQSIKKAGYCVTVGTFETGLAAIAAPIFNDEDAVIGSLTMILNREHAEGNDQLVDYVREAATNFSRELQEGMASHTPRDLHDHLRDAELLGSLHPVQRIQELGLIFFRAEAVSSGAAGSS